MNGYTKRRQALWDAEVARSEAAKLGSYPVCNLCDRPVLPIDKWDESHDGTPKAFGGRITGIAHAPCNRRHGASVIKPLVTKAKNVRSRHTGAYRPRKALPGGRDSEVKIKVGGGIVARIGLAEKMAATLAKRRIGPE